MRVGNVVSLLCCVMILSTTSGDKRNSTQSGTTSSSMVSKEPYQRITLGDKSSKGTVDTTSRSSVKYTPTSQYNKTTKQMAQVTSGLYTDVRTVTGSTTLNYSSQVDTMSPSQEPANTTFDGENVVPTEKDPRFDEHRLYDYLMAGYNKASRPVYNASHPVKIYIGITLNQIFDVDEKNQVLTTHIWLDQEWHDEKLKWDPKDFNGLKVLRLPCSLIWLPDIVLYNSVDEITGKYMQALSMVHFDGTVFWPPIVRMRSSCEIDITFFPFDDQVCKMKVGSWAYDGYQVDVLQRRNGVDTSNYLYNGEWHLVEAKSVRNVVVYPCCPEPYPDLTFTLHMRRRTLYYTYNVIIPCVMLSALTLLVFWLTPDNGEKVTMGLTVLLSFSVFMLLIAENMPATSFYVPLIGVYITMVMALTATSVVLAVFVSNIQARASSHKPIPPRLKQFTHFMAKVCCVHIPEHRKQPKTKSKTNAVKMKILDRNKNGKHTNHHAEKCYSELRLKCNGTMDTECHLVDIDDDYDHVIDQNQTSTVQQSPFVDLDKILNKLDEIIERQDMILDGGHKRSDWIELSIVVDRLLFYLFFFITIASTVGILVVLPLTKTVKEEAS